ncbi:catalase-like domain-containing protein [Scheffersomyces xylosifermentans]|uniref:catalase-like domain-containing protein n=1 Tax=Scheffersomyces xylosifermentans TaxID=1304137 RepID=UPI00315CB3E0
MSKGKETYSVPLYTTSNGCPVRNPNAMIKMGKFGPALLQDHHLIDLLAHFDRERIPERVAHAKGSGAHGYFEVTDDVSDLVYADFLNGIGKKTPLFTRFSTVGGEKGTADSERDPRGFAVKLYTQEGVIDWVNINSPIFFIRNGVQFPFLVHTQKSRDPQTNLKDVNVFWDFLCNNPESVHNVMFVFSDRGTPATYRHMHGYSAHTYKWINKNGDFHYVQIHLKTDQGIKNLNNSESHALKADNPDHAGQDLHESIEKGDFPSWTCYVQTMTAEQAEKAKFSVFDLTKVWPHSEYPLRRFGKLVLDRNPSNYFAEVEQAAFSPANTVPGVEPSADPVLQARLFSYNDTHRHRLGPNFNQIPINCPLQAHNPFQRDGQGCVNGNYGSEPNYPSSFQELNYRLDATNNEAHEKWVGEATSFQWTTESNDYDQALSLWEVFKKTGQREAFLHNISDNLKGARPEVQDRVFELFGKVSSEIEEDVRKATLEVSQRK